MPSRRLVWIAMVLLCAIGAAAAIRRLVVLDATAPRAGPDATFAAKADLTRLHIIPSLIFVLLVPLQFVSSLRRRYPRLHRWIGRMILSLGVVIGVTALRLSAHPVGGVIEGRGDYFLRLLLSAFHRQGLAARPQRASGAPSRLGHAHGCYRVGRRHDAAHHCVFFATSSLTGLTPQQFFGPAMWLGFISTYLAGEVWINYAVDREAATG